MAARACGVALAQARTERVAKVEKREEVRACCAMMAERVCLGKLTLILRSSIRSPEGNVVVSESGELTWVWNSNAVAIVRV